MTPCWYSALLTSRSRALTPASGFEMPEELASRALPGSDWPAASCAMRAIWPARSAPRSIGWPA
eukprot:7960068-Lingulodinium_polyedra.AAC.1